MVKTINNLFVNLVKTSSNLTWRLRYNMRLSDNQWKVLRGIYFITCFLVCIALAIACIGVATQFATNVINY